MKLKVFEHIFINDNAIGKATTNSFDLRYCYQKSCDFFSMMYSTLVSLFKRAWHVFFILLVLCSTDVYSKKKIPTNMEPYAQFIAGISLLKTSPILLNNHSKISSYRKLQYVTDLDSKDVSQFLEYIRTDPELGKLFFDQIRNSLMTQPDTTK